MVGVWGEVIFSQGKKGQIKVHGPHCTGLEGFLERQDCLVTSKSRAVHLFPPAPSPDKTVFYYSYLVFISLIGL